jgi:hypothetical protein
MSVRHPLKRSKFGSIIPSGTRMYIRFGRQLAMQYSERGPRMHSCEEEFLLEFRRVVPPALALPLYVPPSAPTGTCSFVHTTIKFVVLILSPSSHRRTSTSYGSLSLVDQQYSILYRIASHRILSHSKVVYTDHDDATIPHLELGSLGVRFVCHWAASNSGNRSRGC